eukprot:TCONS_00035029-protein
MTDSETRLACYKTYIRPLVEYASSVWDPPGIETLTSKVEAVQRKSLHWIYNKWDRKSSPISLLRDAQLDTLEKRCKMIRLKFFHDVLHNLKHVDKSILPNRQRCKHIKFQQKLGSIQSYTTSFFPQTVKLQALEQSSL